MNKKVMLSIAIIGVLVIFGVSRYRRSLSEYTPPPLDNGLLETTTQQEAYTTVTPIITSAALVRDISLSITTPTPGQVVTLDRITVSGNTSPGADVFINDVETKANAAGQFSAKLILDEGENYILVVANDVNGKYAEKELTVTYTP